MAIEANIMQSTIRKRIGNVVYMHSKGGSVARKYVANPRNPQTYNQMMRRIPMVNVQKIYKKLAPFIGSWWTRRAGNTSVNNAFTKANNSISNVFLLKSDVTRDYYLYDEYQISDGLIPPLPKMEAKNDDFSEEAVWNIPLRCSGQVGHEVKTLENEVRKRFGYEYPVMKLVFIWAVNVPENTDVTIQEYTVGDEFLPDGWRIWDDGSLAISGDSRFVFSSVAACVLVCQDKYRHTQVSTQVLSVTTSIDNKIWQYRDNNPLNVVFNSYRKDPEIIPYEPDNEDE